MLNPKFNYLSFDFETTGLDTKKDEPIQIGMVKFDHNFQVLDTFQSLIKPQKNIKELKEIVRWVTGFQLEDLENAPDASEVFEQCKHFFWTNTVIVWHNIAFDLLFLQRYLPFQPIYQIDTFPLSKTFFHFQQSYALDILNQQLQRKDEGRTGEGSAHDALYDSFASMMIFKYCIKRFTKLRHEHILLDYVLQESTEILHNIIKRTEKPYAFEKKKLFFPPLKTYSKSNKKLVLNNHIIFPKSKNNKWYIGHISFWNLLRNIDRNQKKYIISFTHKNKITLAQQYLDSIDIPYNSLHDNVIFSPKCVNAFLQKKHFTDPEVFFVAKYFSQYNAGHNMIEANSLDDYKIFNALTVLKPQTQKGVLLCTHQQLFQFAHKIWKEYTVLFFDHERRYQNYSKRMKQAFDPLYLINLIDQLQYKYMIQKKEKLLQICKTYLDTLSIFIGALSTEINQLFIWFKENRQDIDYILEHTRFPKTQNLFPKIQEKTKILLDQVPLEDVTLIDKQRQKLKEYLSWVCTVEKKMYQGDKRYYLLHKRDLYLSYEDFLQQLPAASFKFLSNSDTTLPHLKWEKEKTSKKIIKWNIQLKTVTHYKDLAKILDIWIKTQYVLSSSKQKSQDLFHELIKNQVQEKYTIVAENITWWVGKNIYLANQSKKPVIMIWWYNFYLEALAKRFDFSILYLYHIYGNMKEQIVHDVLYYWKK